MTFIGVDAQYFSAVLMPQRENPADVWFDELLPIRVGKADPKHTNLTNTSCRLIGKVQELKPGGALVNRFKLFAGPKKASLLANSEYRLGELIYFGWPIFEWVAVPLTWILHAFYAVVHNYGLAIILLTVLVRGCMFPLSLKQAAGAQKMQMLQPEIKKIQEKHKNNAEARTKAQQELFRKHNYNPLSGCLPIFIQMPVFIGLYRSLMVAIELRDAPLISQLDPLVLEPGRAGHALRLELVHAGVCQQRPRDVRSRAVLQPAAHLDDRAVHLAAEDVHAPGGRRAGRHAAEDHAVHDDLHGRCCSSRWPAACASTSSPPACGAWPSGGSCRRRRRWPEAAWKPAPRRRPGHARPPGIRSEGSLIEWDC